MKRNNKASLKYYGLWSIALLFLVVAHPGESRGDDMQVPPGFFDPDARLARPDLDGRSRIRFLTTTDFPPFNFVDRNGRLAGYHVELIREICAVLDVEAACEIQAMPFDEIEQAIAEGEGEAVIAGLAVTPQTRGDYRFTRSFLRLPARFIERRNTGAADAEVADRLKPDARIGVPDASAHEAMLRAFFPQLRAIPFSTSALMLKALKDDTVDAVFADGVQLGFWLSSTDAGSCCRFLDGPFFSEHYLGEGLAIAVAPDHEELVDAFDYALLALSRDGTLGDIYLRSFPNGLY